MAAPKPEHKSPPFFLSIFLAHQRAHGGWFELKDHDWNLLLDGPARGKADGDKATAKGNPERNPVLPYGDTPSGGFDTTRVVMFAQPHPRLGLGWVPLEGASGDAHTAKQNGRTGLGVHAGRGDGQLISTFGCVRLLDRDFAKLAQIVGDAPLGVQIVDAVARKAIKRNAAGQMRRS